MNLGLRVRLIGTLVFGILVFFAISAFAASTTMSGELSKLGRQQVQSGATGLAGYWDEKKDQVRLLTQQVAADVKSADGKTSHKLETGLGLVAAAPISDANERTIGAIYGGVVMNHYYEVVDQATRALGGKAAEMWLLSICLPKRWATA